MQNKQGLILLFQIIWILAIKFDHWMINIFCVQATLKYNYW